MSYEASQKTRQSILDYLHANPMKSANQIAIGIHKGRDTVQSCVKFMTSRREIEKTGQGMTTAYRALVKTTISAKQVVAEMQGKRAAVQSGMSCTTGKQSAPGYYCQRGGGWQAQASAGGQGALRREFGIQSVMA